LGFDAHAIAKEMAKRTVRRSGLNKSKFGLDENMNGQISPSKYSAKDDSVGEIILQMLSEIYNCRLFDKVKSYYNDEAVVHFICDKNLTGFNQIQGMLVNLFSSFPNAKFIVERITCNRQPATQGHDVAVRWRLSGLHEGYGFFGTPSNRPVEILGITHYAVTNKKITEEWVTFDGLDVLKQIYMSDENPDCAAS